MPVYRVRGNANEFVTALRCVRASATRNFNLISLRCQYSRDRLVAQHRRAAAFGDLLVRPLLAGCCLSSPTACTIQSHIVILPPASEFRDCRTFHLVSVGAKDKQAAADQCGRFHAPEAWLFFSFGCWALIKYLSQRRCQPYVLAHCHWPLLRSNVMAGGRTAVAYFRSQWPLNHEFATLMVSCEKAR